MNYLQTENIVAYKVCFNLRMFWVKSLIYHSNNHSCTSDISPPHIDHIVCWTIISFLENAETKCNATEGSKADKEAFIIESISGI